MSFTKNWELRSRASLPSYKEPKESDIYISGADKKARRSSKPKKQQELFTIEILEESSTEYKVHYVDYDSSHDEWKDKDEIVDFPHGSEEETVTGCQVERFSLYQELAVKIKASLNSSRKESPVVHIDMTFDKIEFDGGLRLCGKVKRSVRSIKRYTVSRYQDLIPLLGTTVE